MVENATVPQATQAVVHAVQNTQHNASVETTNSAQHHPRLGGSEIARRQAREMCDL